MDVTHITVNVQVGAIQEQTADLVVVNLFEGVETPGGATGAVDAAAGGAIRALLAAGDFKGKLNDTAALYPPGAPFRRILVVGLGKQEQLNVDRVRQAAATAARRARALGVTRYLTVLHGAGAGGLDPETAAQAVAEGTILGLYRFDVHKTELEPSDTRQIEEAGVVVFAPEQREAVERGVRAGQAIARATWLARDLINQPSNVLTPTALADLAAGVAGRHGLRSEVLGPDQIEALGMGALLAVARGSRQEPRFIILQHNADRTEMPAVVLVGKGITFDSGGISIKPAEGMERMKGDMAGAAAVLGALQAAAELGIPLRVVGLIPATENMPGGRATRPGDIVRALRGKTIEIQNTDAEGRLVLADAVGYAARFDPAAVVDLATLTGSILIALGDQAAGLMTHDDGLAARLTRAGAETFERVWRLPLFEEYAEQLKSDVADVKNVGGRPAGSITGALFIAKFAEGLPWAHLDIYGTHWSDKDRPYVGKGPVGWGVRLLVQFLRDWAAEA